MKTVPELIRADADTYEKKAADYAPDPEAPFENFEFAGNFTDRVIGNYNPFAESTFMRASSCLTLIGTKISRLMTLGLGGAAKNESVLDTIRDLRVYLAILEAMLREDHEREMDAIAGVVGAK